tara:strand:+ start:217 stop:591 length:375 start_codon:yes stop_codon:yes gene_type:complete
MNNISYAECILELVPGAEFTMIENDYSTIIWQNDNYIKPIEEEILIKKAELENLFPLKILRNERLFKIMETDKYGLADYPFSSDTKKQEWLAYRQALRDLPTNQTPQLDSDGNLTNITWPTEPS